MTDEKLIAQIAQEAKELADIPKIPIAQFYQGTVQRCHMCGALVRSSDLEAFDGRGPQGNQRPRKACKDCRRA